MANDPKNTRTDKPEEKQGEEKLEGSKSDPQKTEFEGLKQGGVEPPTHREDKEDFREGDFEKKKKKDDGDDHVSV